MEFGTWNLKSLTVRAFASEREFYRLWFEFRISSGPFDDVLRHVHLDVDELSARGADSVIVPVRHPVKARRAVAELDLGNVAGLFEISQRVINGRERDARQKLFRRSKNIIRR